MKTMDRQQILWILDNALSVGEAQFVRDVAVAWLAMYPGDLRVKLYHAQAMMQENRPHHAIPVLWQVCDADPLFLPAWETLAACYPMLEDAHLAKFHDEKSLEQVYGALAALRYQPDPTATGPEWGMLLWFARQEMIENNLDEAEVLVQQALAEAPESRLTAVVHIEVLIRRSGHYTRYAPAMKGETQPIISPNSPAIGNIAGLYHNLWSDCVYFGLILADSWMDSGNSEKAVVLLHKAAALDVEGQTAERIWGSYNPYTQLWPNQMVMALERSIPANLSGVMGLNLLPAERGFVSPYQHEWLEMSAKHPNAVPNIKRQPIAKPVGTEEQENKAIDFGRADGRMPVYVVLTTRAGLEKKYGTNGAARVEFAISTLTRAVDRYHEWGSVALFADDPTYTNPYALEPVTANTSAQLKTLVSQLDDSLREKGEMIGALLIVGGPDIVPFHHLANPIDDLDEDVVSDNPYATRDQNYFIPEWPVGRLPDGKTDQPSLLLTQLQNIIKQHRKRQRSQGWWFGMQTNWLEGLLFQLGLKTRSGSLTSFGYSTEVWQRASRTVFRPIGNPDKLVISPPHIGNGLTNSHTNGKDSMQGQLGYFNLHGLADSNKWYGQRDPYLDTSGPDYPEALAPYNMHKGKVPAIVFTEACYGAHILDKDVNDAMSLKFIEAGTEAVIGSTVIAYGSVRTPLVAADFLGHTFWRFLRSGKPVGESLRRAKIALAQEMHTRQGFLDGEDQKTLISFVLYGDPLAWPWKPKFEMSAKTIPRAERSPQGVHAVCDRFGDETQLNERYLSKHLSPKMMKNIKKTVVEYLPGMSDARMRVSYACSPKCTDDCRNCPIPTLGAGDDPSQDGRRVVTLQKQVKQAKHIHSQYARITLNRGKVVKMVVSR